MPCPNCGMQTHEITPICLGCGADLEATALGAGRGRASETASQHESGGGGGATTSRATSDEGGAQAAANPAKSMAEPSPPRLTDMPVFQAILVPARDPEVVPRLIRGGFLAQVPIVGPFWLVGYALRWTRELTREQRPVRLPPWTDRRGLFFEGLRASVIVLAFHIVPVALTGFLVIPKILSVAYGIRIISHEIIWSIVVNLSLGLFILMLFSLPIPLAMCHYVHSGELLASIRPSTWRPLITRAPSDFADSWRAVVWMAVVGWWFLPSPPGGGGFPVFFTIAGLLAWKQLGFLAIIPILGAVICMAVALAWALALMLVTQTVFTRYWLRHSEPNRVR